MKYSELLTLSVISLAMAGCAYAPGNAPKYPSSDIGTDASTAKTAVIAPTLVPPAPGAVEHISAPIMPETNSNVAPPNTGGTSGTATTGASPPAAGTGPMDGADGPSKTTAPSNTGTTGGATTSGDAGTSQPGATTGTDGDTAPASTKTK